MKLRRLLAIAALGLGLAAGLVRAEDVRVATLNCCLLFSPAVSHESDVGKESPLTPAQYREKIRNLLTLVKDADFVGVEETGGRAELEDLARASNRQWAFAKGKDVFTGEEVGALYSLPGWKVMVNGRVGELDRLVSKHLLVTAMKDKIRIRFLVVHLLRPLGGNESKHQAQVAAIGRWAAKLRAMEPDTSIVILGDTNDARVVRGGSLFGVGRESGELLGFSATHLDGNPYDRIVLVGTGMLLNAGVQRPPFGGRPNNATKRVWTDHFAMEATLRR